MREINLNRQKLGLEDLLFGVGIVTQIRAGQNVDVTRINAGNLPFDETQTLLEWVQSTNLEVLGSMTTELQAIYDNLTTIGNVEANLTVINTLEDNLVALQSLYTNIAKLQNIDTNMSKLQNIDTNMSKLQNIDTNMSKLQAIYLDLTKLESIYDKLTMLTAIYSNLTALNNINSQVIPNLTELLLVNDNAAQVAADKLTVSTDKGIVVGYKDDVSAMKVAVETIYDTFNNSASQALTSRNQAETFAQQASASALSVDVNTLVHRTDDETIAGIKTFSSNIVGNITGNSATATKLATARTINGVAFDGSANITVSDATAVNLTGNQTVAGVKTFSSNPISTAVQSTTTNALTRRDYVDTKAPIASPTFTGTVTLPATTSIGNVSSTELGYLEGATSNIQTQLTGMAHSSHTHPVGEVTGLGTAATRNVGTEYGNVMAVAQYGLIANGLVNVEVRGTNNDVWNTWNNIISGWGNGSRTGSPEGLNGTIGKVLNIGVETWGTQLFFDYYGNQVFFRGKESIKSTPNPWRQLYHTGNTTKNPDGTIKASSPVINLYTDKYDIHNEEQFGATPVITRKSKGVYEITGTLGLRSEGWYLDTPNDRNGNKYLNIEWTQNITPDAVDGVVDEYRDDIVVTIETFERVWNKDTGLFDNGNPIDINDLQNRFVQLRFNEIKVEQEVTNG